VRVEKKVRVCELEYIKYKKELTNSTILISLTGTTIKNLSLDTLRRTNILMKNKLEIIDNLKNINNSNELNELSNQLYSELYDLLKQKIKENK
jgi:hypothetical protein